MTNKLYLFAPRGRRTTRACFRSLAKSMLTYAVVCGFYSQSPVWASEKPPLPMQTPTAQSVGTSTNLKSAAQVLLSHFEELKKHKKDWITEDDLQSLVESPDPVVREAVRFFAVSPIDRELCGEAQGMTKAGLARCIPVAGSAGLEETLLRLGHATGDVKDEAQRKFYATLLRDPGVPAVVRAQIVARLSEKDMLAIVGHPNTQGNAKDVADETAAFLFLAKMSWLGTAEAEAVAAYKVPYVMLRGDKDHSASFWDGHQVHLSEKMLTGGTGVVSDQTLVKHIGTFAHESGHAIFGFSGLSKTVGDDIARRHLENGVGVIINEAVAGIMQNRAHVAELGYGADKGSDANLSVAHDVEKNIANDQTDYARRYHVNTAVARSQMDDIRKVLANSVVPYFQSKFGLLGDPQLTLTLPDPQR